MITVPISGNLLAAVHKPVRFFRAAGVVVMLAATLAWPGCGGGASSQELAAKAELAKLGALVVMDSAREHVAGVTLATLKSPDALGEAVRLLPALPRINSVNADGTALNDEQAAVLGQLTTLQDLVLSHTQVTDAGVAKLRSLRNLKSLHLADTAVTGASLATLAELSALSVLDLSNTKIGGDFAALRGLQKLNWLVLRGLTLDAAALQALGECQSLQRLSLNGATAPADAVKALRQQRPELTVDQ